MKSAVHRGMERNLKILMKLCTDGFVKPERKNVPLSVTILKAKVVKYVLSFGVNDFPALMVG